MDATPRELPPRPELTRWPPTCCRTPSARRSSRAAESYGRTRPASCARSPRGRARRSSRRSAARAPSPGSTRSRSSPGWRTGTRPTSWRTRTSCWSSAPASANSPRTTTRSRPAAGSIQIEADLGKLESNHPALGIHADARLALPALLETVRRTAPDAAAAERVTRRCSPGSRTASPPRNSPWNRTCWRRPRRRPARRVAVPSGT